MRFPAFLIDHPLETLVAGVLLLALIFGNADHHAAEVASQNGPQNSIAARM